MASQTNGDEDSTNSKTTIRSVMKKGEEKSFQDLGLGRGVDATNPTPWLNKRPLQIREVYYDDIIGTEEGNLYQGFVNEVESTQHFQTNLSASVPVNQLVNLGIDSELSRSYSVSQKSVGRKITTRTISFRAPFDKICKTPQGSADAQNGKKEFESRAKPFEDRLKEWIGQQREEEEEKKRLEGEQEGGEQNGEIQKQGDTQDGPGELQQRDKQDGEIQQQRDKQDGEDGEIQQQGDKQGGEIQKQGEQGKQGRKKGDKKKVMINVHKTLQLTQEECLELCNKFVSTFSVTHYVHSLELGASYYRVMSLEEYSTKFSSKAKLGVGQLADIAIGNEKSFNAKKYKSQTTQVGRMNLKVREDEEGSKSKNDKSKENSGKERDEGSKNGKDDEKDGDPKVEEEVMRSSIAEAVVGVKLQPISSLVFGSVGLRIALQKALQLYIHNKQKIKFGPFYIACNWDQLYLTVNKSKNHEVRATYDIDRASEFYIVRCDEGDNHFNIVHESPVVFKRDGDRKKFVEKVGEVEHKPAIPMYLCASVNWRGQSKRNQPLRMRLDGKSTNSRMAIHCRKSRLYHPADLTEWVNEKEIFFINCQERSFTAPVGSYLCVYESGETGCKPTIESHDDKRKFMLFRLIKPKENAQQSSRLPAPVDHLTKGPFLIKHTDTSGDFFIKVSEEKQVQLTGLGESDDAHQFFIRRVSEYSDYFEILSAEDQQLHLTATVDWRGRGIHPPQMRTDVNDRSYMAIYDKKSWSKERKPEDPRKCGEDENEAFYISWYTKPAFSKNTSYLIVKRESKLICGDDAGYWIGCVPNIRHGQPMLFKFVKPRARAQEAPREPEDTPHREGRIATDDGSDDDRHGEGRGRLHSITVDVTPRPS